MLILNADIKGVHHCLASVPLFVSWVPLLVSSQHREGNGQLQCATAILLSASFCINFPRVVFSNKDPTSPPRSGGSGSEPRQKSEQASSSRMTLPELLEQPLPSRVTCFLKISPLKTRDLPWNQPGTPMMLFPAQKCPSDSPRNLIPTPLPLLLKHSRQLPNVL